MNSEANEAWLPESGIFRLRIADCGLRIEPRRFDCGLRNEPARLDCGMRNADCGMNDQDSIAECGTRNEPRDLTAAPQTKASLVISHGPSVIGKNRICEVVTALAVFIPQASARFSALSLCSLQCQVLNSLPAAKILTFAASPCFRVSVSRRFGCGPAALGLCGECL